MRKWSFFLKVVPFVHTILENINLNQNISLEFLKWSIMSCPRNKFLKKLLPLTLIVLFCLLGFVDCGCFSQRSERKNSFDVFRPKTPFWNSQEKGSGGKAVGFYFIRISKCFPAQNCRPRSPFHKNVGVMTLVKRLTRTGKIIIMDWIPQSPPILWVCSKPWWYWAVVFVVPNVGFGVELGSLTDRAPSQLCWQMTVKKTLSNFRRTHHDNWQEHKQQFTDDQLLVLTDLLVSPCYYA